LSISYYTTIKAYFYKLVKHFILPDTRLLNGSLSFTANVKPLYISTWLFKKITAALSQQGKI